MERCLGCMELAADNEKCPKCGFDIKNYAINPRCLRLNTTLNNRYIVGKVLGEGGFGITYIGWDAVLDLPVAIKEYFPANVALRDTTNGPDIYVYEGKSGEAYREGLNRCIKEVKSLSKFHDLTGVVSIHDFFYANGTAYIIMEYLRGITLKEYVKKNGKIRPDHVFQLMKPILRSLAGMHKTGMIHRDISPDNIMVTVDGKIKLIDFGAARISDVDEKSYTIFLKRGYTPEEQYRTNGQQGPWTDVYAVSGTMYYMITGQTPPEALERAIEDTLQEFGQLGIEFPKRQQDAIIKGLGVFHKDRYQSISDLYQGIYDESLEFISNTTIGEGNGGSVIDIVLQVEDDFTQSQKQIAQVLNEMTVQPEKKEQGEAAEQSAAENESEDAGQPVAENKSENVSRPEDDDSQSKDKGLFVDEDESEAVPQLEEDNLSEMAERLVEGDKGEELPEVGAEESQKPENNHKKKKGIAIALAAVAAVAIIVGVVLSNGMKKENPDDKTAAQAQAAQTLVPVQTEEPEPTPVPAKEFRMAGVKGKEEFDAKEAINALGDEELKTTVKYAYDEKVKKGHVISQSIAENSSYVQGEEKEIVLTVSKGPKMIKVPDLLGKKKGNAIKLLHKKGLKYKIKDSMHSSAYAKGKVMKQSISSGKKVRKNKVVELVISLGKEKVVATPRPQVQSNTPKPIRKPDPTRRPTPTKKPTPTRRPEPIEKSKPIKRPDPFS